MPMKMTRRPRVKRRILPEVLREIKFSYEFLALVTKKRLESEVSDWSNRPVIRTKVTVNKKRWVLSINTDNRFKGSKIYNWVSDGTGSRGNDPRGKTYFIFPKRKQALVFPLPMNIKTIPNPPKFAPSFFASPATIVTGKVTAPGIFPRNLGKDVYEHLKSSKSGSFRNVTEAAIKRALRRVGFDIG